MGAWIEIAILGLSGAPASVAPLVGAWIEIVVSRIIIKYDMSLPLWERGLKYWIYHSQSECSRVAPLVGAWIEIIGSITYWSGTQVAPLVGAWIEIFLGIIRCDSEDCRSPCGSVD